MVSKLSNKLIEILKNTDTPTVNNSIELAQSKRGYSKFTKKTMHPLHNTPLVAMGFARTAKIAATSPTTLSVEDNQKLRMDYYRYMGEGARPAICVIEDTDSDPIGAYWGEVNTNVHKGLGITGTLTNGIFRDLGMCPDDYQILGGGIGPSHMHVHIKEIGTKVNIFGMEVCEGDFVHADRNGACVIPLDILAEIDKWIIKMQDIESIILKPSKRAGFNFEKLEKAWAELEKKRV